MAERNFDYMGWVKTQACCLSPDGLTAAGLGDRPGRPDWSNAIAAAGPCSGQVEADHAGLDRGLSQKAPDDTCIPLCSGHHRDRTEERGFFGGLDRDAKRSWRLAAILRHQMRYSRWRAAAAVDVF